MTVAQVEVEAVQAAPNSAAVPAQQPNKEKKTPQQTKQNAKPKVSRLVLEESRWNAQHFTNTEEGALPIEIAITENKQTVNIVSCVKSTFVVKGKFTRLVLNSCVGVNVVVDEVIATVELVRGKGIQLQVNKSVPQIAIDKCEGVTLFFQSAQSWQSVEIVTSLSEGVNIERVSENETTEWPEVAVPSQFISHMDTSLGRFVTRSAEHV